jgi:hypothetical protein
MPCPTITCSSWFSQEPLTINSLKSPGRAHARCCPSRRGGGRLFLAKHVGLKTGDGRERVVRHGHLPEREVMTGIGPVAIACPMSSASKATERAPRHPIRRLRMSVEDDVADSESDVIRRVTFRHSHRIGALCRHLLRSLLGFAGSLFGRREGVTRDWGECPRRAKGELGPLPRT